MESVYSAFHGQRRIVTGVLATVVAAVHAAASQDAAQDPTENSPLLVFRHTTGTVVDLDTRGSLGDMLGRLEIPAAAARGRPKLGVVPREITLLPRHWEWLAAQPGGASAALRRLVDVARRNDDGSQRMARDAAYRFMVAIGGDLPGFEAASRALFSGDEAGFAALIAAWPADIRDTIVEIAGPRVP